MTEYEYRHFPGTHGSAPLLNDVRPKSFDEPKETAHSDVLAAVRSVGATETRNRLADEIGPDRISKMAMWDRRISEVGPVNAANEAAALYSAAPVPRPPAP